MGDLRYIDESTKAWQMDVRSIAGKAGGSLPENIEAKIEELDAEYKKKFESFYADAMEKDQEQLADKIRSAFDELWIEKHPDFYDVEKLLESWK